MEALISLVVLGIPVGVLAYFGRRKQKRFEEVMGEGEPAFRDALDIDEIRRAPDLWRERLHGRVFKVYTASIPMFTGGGRSGGGRTPSYRSFVLDINGEVHDLGEGRRFAEVEEHAKWLAQLLDVPYESNI